MAAKTNNPDIAVLQAQGKSMEAEIVRLSTKLDTFIADQRKRDEQAATLAASRLGELDSRYVTKEEFAPYKRGAILIGSTVLLTLVGALMKLILIP